LDRGGILGTWALLQIVVDIFLALGFFVVIMRMSRAPKDDPRLSRGLQLLQSKISVLEDLSDRTEVQVSQLTAILEQKCREVQAKVQLAEQHVHAIRVSMDRSLEVAKIFQDKIPHQEIIERRNTLKYVQAARMAHQGSSADDIALKIDLPKGELEFIAKVNRERLMFNEDQLPSWAQSDSGLEGEAPRDEAALESGLSQSSTMAPNEDQPTQPEMTAEQSEQEDNTHRLRAEMELAEHQRLVENLSRLQFEMQSLDQQLAKDSSNRDLSAAFEIQPAPKNSLQKLGDQFRQACEEANQEFAKPSHGFPPLEQLAQLIPQLVPRLTIDFNEDTEAAPEADRGAGATAGVAAGSAAGATASVGSDKDGQRIAQKIASSVTNQPATDPQLLRAAAQAKVQAALSRGSASQPRAEAAPDGLQAARLMAQEAAFVAPAVPRILNARGSSTHPPVIRKVEFPKIDR
jgi:hypothetical protein